MKSTTTNTDHTRGALIPSTFATLNDLAVGTVIADEAGDMVAQKEADDAWTIAWADDCYENGRRIERHRTNRDVLSRKIYLATVND